MDEYTSSACVLVRWEAHTIQKTGDTETFPIDKYSVIVHC